MDTATPITRRALLNSAPALALGALPSSARAFSLPVITDTAAALVVTWRAAEAAYGAAHDEFVSVAQRDDATPASIEPHYQALKVANEAVGRARLAMLEALLVEPQ